MDRDQLMKMLNLKPEGVRHDGQSRPSRQMAVPGVGAGRPGGGTAVASPFALQLDAFDQAQGAKLLRHNHHLRATNLEHQAVADFNAAFFNPSPQLVESCVDNRRLEFVTKTMETPDYLALHRSTELNPVASELATVSLAQSYAKLKEEDKKREDKQQEARAKGKSVNEAREAAKAEMACLKAVSKALKAAEKEVESFEETMSALGCGHGQGGDSKLDVGKVAQMFQHTKDSEILRRIMELAGRYRRSAQARQRQKTVHGLDDMIGVVLDGDVGRLLPHELAQLATPELELDAMRRLVEKKSMCRQYRGVEKVGKGPIVVVVDESGSMHGEPVAQAKAFALAMCWIAKHQNRWAALVGFAGGTEGTRLALPPGKWDEAKLLEWLEHFYSGGTSCDVPCQALPDIYWQEFLSQDMKRGRTDLILITDAIVRLPPDVEHKFLKWKQEEKVRCFTMVMGQAEAGDLARISDEVYPVLDLNLDQEAVQKCFSI